MRTVCYEYNELPECDLEPNSILRIAEHSPEISIIFRLLSGSCSITSLHDGEIFDLDTNYFLPGCPKNADRTLGFLNGLQEEIVLSDYEEFITENPRVNKNFYRNFLNELTAAILHEEKSAHTATFVHLYRTYEHLSYAFPMIYASKTDDYIGTFENLRKWLTNTKSDENVGELRFHKTFLETLFSGQPLLASTIDIDITVRAEQKERVFDALCRKTLGWKSARDYTGETTRPDKISISFLEFHSFIINLRNRFFHYANGRSDNLGVEDIIAADTLFSMVNKAVLAYVATILHEIVLFKMS